VPHGGIPEVAESEEDQIVGLWHHTILVSSHIEHLRLIASSWIVPALFFGVMIYGWPYISSDGELERR
jgi:hypothetical protein